MTIQANLQQLRSGDGLADLYILNCSKLGGSVYYFSPDVYANGDFVSWGGQTYSLIPIGIDATERTASNTNLPQPSLTISNVGGPLLSVIASFGDLTGATITHYVVKVSNLDTQSNPDTSQFIGPDVWYLFQKTVQTNQTISWTLACVIDRPGFMLPIRQILKDPNINAPDGIYFPGVSPYRTDPSQSQ